ncbi:hypothetical protein Q1695_013067 [Nippostrongylus brasiliensis]|nr:hypothetical protein Q1695_013067 [Nippostrongylus brasiliensis]
MRVTPLLLILVFTVSTVLGRSLTSLLKQKAKLFNYDRDSDSRAVSSHIDLDGADGLEYERMRHTLHSIHARIGSI